jgi:hypothetical protein
MRTKHLCAAVVGALATAVAPVAAGAQQGSDPTAKAQFLGKISKKAGKAQLRVRYTCSEGDALWVSAKQSRSGRRDARLTKEGSSRVAAAWLQSHRNRFTCDGAAHTATFTVDKQEKGSKGRLRKGRAWVQFCVTKGEGLALSKTGWVAVG